MNGTRHLVTFLTDDDADLHLARRRIAHDRITFLVHDGQQGRAEDLAQRERNIAGPDAAHVVSIPRHDMHEALERMRTLLNDLPEHDTVTLNLAGAEPAHVSAATILAFDTGIPTVLCQHDHIATLPILMGLQLHDRFDADERKVMARLSDEPQPVEHLAQHLLIPKHRIHKAGRQLKEKGLVDTHVQGGTTSLGLTQQGRRLRAHVV